MSKWQKIIMIFTLFLLVGCENAEIKKTLQDGFDNANPTGNRGVCFTVGSIDYPYTTKYVEGKLDDFGFGLNREKKRNENLNQRLAMFARLGLLSETAAVDDNGQPTGFYQYNFTDEGLKYKAYYLGGTSQVFCFGRVIVDSIGNQLWDPNKTMATIRYYYHIEGEIPEWATSPELNMIFGLSNNNEKIDWDNRHTIESFIKTKEGLKPFVFAGILIFGT